MVVLSIAQCQTSASILMADGVARYRRLTFPRRVALWVGLLFVTMVLLRPYPGRHSFGPVSPPPFKPPFYGRPPAPLADAQTWRERSREVKGAFQHAYKGYEQFAFGHDEFKPLSNGTVENLNGWGLTIVDSLDTMLLMGLDEEFERAMEFVKNIDYTQKSQTIGFFETIIRYVGGLLSAYHLTSTSHKSEYRELYPPMLLRKVEELSGIVGLAFNTTSGLPSRSVKVRDRVITVPDSHGGTALAEMGSCQMEFKYLSHLTNKDVYFRQSDRVMDFMEKHQGKTPTPTIAPNEDGTVMVERLSTNMDTGLWNNHWYLEDGNMFGDSISVGAMGDSGYEYLLKQYLLTGRTEERLLKMYLKAMDGVIHRLLYLSKDQNLLYVTNVGNWGTPSGSMEHLACFLPGVLALGARLLDPEYPWMDRFNSRVRSRSPLPSDSDSLRRTLDLHMRAAVGLAHTCWVMYDEMPTGVGPEIMHFYSEPVPEGTVSRHAYESLRWGPRVAAWEQGGRRGPLIGTEGWDMTPLEKPDRRAKDGRYMLRPEALEAMYLLWRTTGDPLWRERGWRMFDAINKLTKVEHGYASTFYVESENPRHVDDMPSFFLAETLKYAYLLTLDEDPLPLDQVVFNTEAHPLPVFKWTREQIAEWGIH